MTDAPFNPAASTCGHEHNTAEAWLACHTARSLHAATKTACVVAINANAPGRPDLADPAVSIIGNTTDVANMVGAILDMVFEQPRPTSCAACASNFDAMLRARAALADRVGSC